MELEVYFKSNGRNYEALKGRQPDFKTILFRNPTSKPKLIITPNDALQVWGSEQIKKITHVNGVAVELTLQGGNYGYYHCMLSEREVEKMTDISLAKKLRHIFVGTPKPKMTQGISGVAVSDDGDMYYKSDKNVYKMSADTDEKIYPETNQDIIAQTRKDIDELTLGAKNNKIPRKPSDGSDQPVAPQPMQVPAQQLIVDFKRLDGRNEWIALYGTHILRYYMTGNILSAPSAFYNQYTINNVPVKFKSTPDVLNVRAIIPPESESMLLGNAYAPPFYNEDVVYKGKTDSQGNTPAITQLVVSQPITPTHISVIFKQQNDDVWTAKYQEFDIKYNVGIKRLTTMAGRLRNVEMINHVYAQISVSDLDEDILIHQFPSDFDPTALLRNPFKDGSPADPEKLEDAEKDMDALIEKDDSFVSFTGPPTMPDVVHEKLKEVEEELGIQIPRDTVIAVTTATVKDDSFTSFDPGSKADDAFAVVTGTVKGDEVTITDQKVYSPEPEIRHIPLKEPPEIRWDSMTNGYLTGTLTVFGTALSIKMEPNHTNGYETIYVDTKTK